MALAGVLASLTGMLLVFVYTANVKTGGGDGEVAETAPAFVAIADVSVGTRWEDMTEVVQKREVPLGLHPASAVSEVEDLEGKAAVRAITKGEVITTGQFDPFRSGSLATPKGHDAVTINVAAPQGVALYVQPGAKANIYASFKGSPAGVDPEDAVVTKLLLSNITVLANRTASLSTVEGEVAGEPAPAPNSESLLTLAVTPEQAEKLIFAKENGTIWLGLPHPENPLASTEGRTFRTAFL